MENNIQRLPSVNLLKWVLILLAIIQPIIVLLFGVLLDSFGGVKGQWIEFWIMVMIFIMEICCIVSLDKMRKSTLTNFVVLILFTFILIFGFFTNDFQGGPSYASMSIWYIYLLAVLIMLFLLRYVWTIRNKFIN